jgi:predicted aldo/keto reductase-like oxidoreductase
MRAGIVFVWFGGPGRAANRRASLREAQHLETPTLPLCNVVCFAAVIGVNPTRQRFQTWDIMSKFFEDAGRHGFTRREFMKLSAAAGVVLGVAPGCAREVKNEMPYRTLGSTGEKVSLIGLGGYHAGLQSDEEDSITLIRTAVDRGINFMDNCWDYNGGQSEIRMGKALRDGYRDKVFLMSKIDGRTKEAAAQQIDESLKRLQTDRVDLMQFHEIIRMEDPEKIFAAGAAMEAMLAAKKAGKVRYIGFTGHKDPAMHLKMLQVADENKFHFDAVQMPLSVMDAHFHSFEKQVLPVLVKNGIGVLAMKTLGFGAILRSNTVTAIECLQYAMNLPTSVIITGMEDQDRLDQALEAASTFKPMTAEQVSALLARTIDAAADGKYETFKTTTGFDGTTQHPQWLG